MATERRKFWLKLALGVSLSLNLLIVGGAVGAFFNHAGEGPEMRGGPGGGLFGMVAMLPREDREAFRRSFGPRDGGRPHANGVNPALIEELQRPEVSSERLTQILAQNRSLRDNAVVRAEATLVQILSQMPLEQRKDYAARLQRMHGWH